MLFHRGMGPFREHYGVLLHNTDCLYTCVCPYTIFVYTLGNVHRPTHCGISELGFVSRHSMLHEGLSIKMYILVKEQSYTTETYSTLASVFIVRFVPWFIPCSWRFRRSAP